MRSRAKTIATKLFFVLLGNILYGFTVAVFIEPSGLITGGATGIAIFLNKVTGTPVSIFALGLNALMFILGYFLLGKAFALTTAISTITYPLAMNLAERILDGYVLTNDIVLCTVLGGLLIGVSVGMVMRVGSSTGGLDIPPLALQRYRGIPVGVSTYVVDIMVLILQMFYTRGDAALYGVVMVLIYSIVLEKTISFGTSKIQVTIISEKANEIRQKILKQLDRGVTMLAGRKGFSMKDTELVMSVLSTRELPKMKVMVQDIDPEAFLIITTVSEVRGRGFSTEKKPIEDEEN